MAFSFLAEVEDFVLAQNSQPLAAELEFLMITSLYAGLLALVFAWISGETILARRKHKVSLGAGPNQEIAGQVSAHANFVAYVPLLLIMLGLVENAKLVPVWVLHLIGLMILLGRLCHFMAFRGPKMDFKLRTLGMQLTLWPMIALAIMNILVFFDFWRW